MFSEDLGFLDLGSRFLEEQRFFGLWQTFSEDERFWILAHVFRGPRIFRSWLTFFRGPRVFWALANVFRGRKVLDPGSCFSEDERFWILPLVSQRTKGFLGFGSCLQRTKGSGSWLIFFRGPRVFLALAYVFRGLKVLYPGLCFQRT